MIKLILIHKLNTFFSLGNHKKEHRGCEEAIC
jgi:hypothetical protein